MDRLYRLGQSKFSAKLAAKAMDSGIGLAAFPNRTNRVNEITSGGIVTLGDLGLSSPAAAKDPAAR